MKGLLMRLVLKPIPLCPVSAVSLSALAAHDYFNELKSVNTFNNHQDRYVCFLDDNSPTSMSSPKSVVSSDE